MLIIILALIPNIASSYRSDNGIEKAMHIIKVHEGFSRVPHNDGGTLRIGYGFYAGKRKNITEEVADSILQHKLLRCASYLEERITVELTESKFVALIDHIYNVGSLSRKLIDLINSGSDTATAELLAEYKYGRIIKDGVRQKVKLRGLVLRSSQRAKLYLGIVDVDTDIENKHKMLRVIDAIREDDNQQVRWVYFDSSNGTFRPIYGTRYIELSYGQSGQTCHKRRLWNRADDLRERGISPVPCFGHWGCVPIRFRTSIRC